MPPTVYLLMILDMTVSLLLPINDGRKKIRLRIDQVEQLNTENMAWTNFVAPRPLSPRVVMR